MSKPCFIYPDWPAPSNIKAFSTTRSGGFSQSPFDSLNLGQHVGDDLVSVNNNRLLLPNSENVTWLEQVHGNDCLDLDTLRGVINPKADACFSTLSNRVCAVMTADCLPILLCDELGSCVAAIHAGWRGLATGVIENTVAKMPTTPSALFAWMGPAISQAQFEVGPEVKAAFSDYPYAFKSNTTQAGEKYLADLYQIASDKLNSLGIERVYGGEYCTYSQPELFFSHRRATHETLESESTKTTTGRMATAIYIQ